MSDRTLIGGLNEGGALFLLRRGVPKKQDCRRCVQWFPESEGHKAVGLPCNDHCPGMGEPRTLGNVKSEEFVSLQTCFGTLEFAKFVDSRPTTPKPIAQIPALNTPESPSPAQPFIPPHLLQPGATNVVKAPSPSLAPKPMGQVPDSLSQALIDAAEDEADVEEPEDDGQAEGDTGGEE